MPCFSVADVPHPVQGLHPNRDLKALTGQLRGLDPTTLSTGQTTYDLRRRLTHGLIERVPHSHRHKVTDQGLRDAMLLTRVHE